jgi:membrane protein YdbS with pleckstrin-like domain
MNRLVKGILTVIAVSILLIILTFFAGIIGMMSGTQSGWEGLFAVLGALIISGIIYLVMLIVAVVKYSKTQDDFFKGMIYGILVLSGIFLITAFVLPML